MGGRAINPGLLRFIGPMDAIDRADVHGLLNLVRRGARGVHDLGESQGFVYRKDLGADFFADPAGNAVIFRHIRHMVRQYPLLLVGRSRRGYTNKQPKDYFCHSERRAESLLLRHRDSSLRYAPFRMT